MPTVILLRHGRTTANATGLLAGWSPGVELDEVGRDQASAVAERLAALPIVRVVSSPLTRCLQTAEALVTRLGTTYEEEVDLGECRYGGWTGRPLAELAKEPLWRTVQDRPSEATFPESSDFSHESMSQMWDRATGAVRRLSAQVQAEHGPEALWVAVSHGDVIKAILTDAAGAGLDSIQRVNVDPASLSVIRFAASPVGDEGSPGPLDFRPMIVRVNDIGGDLAGLRPREGQPGDLPAGDAAVGGGAGTAS